MSNTSVSGQISREVLIPLVAVDYMKPELLEEPRLRQKELSTETNDRAELILKNALKAHMENGLKWPPTESEIEQFDKLRAIIRMSGNGETAMSAKAGGSAG
jgi:hypothetical protein